GDLPRRSDRERGRLVRGDDRRARLQATDDTACGSAGARALRRESVRPRGGPAVPQHLDRTPLVDGRTGIVGRRHAGAGMAPPSGSGPTTDPSGDPSPTPTPTPDPVGSTVDSVANTVGNTVDTVTGVVDQTTGGATSSASQTVGGTVQTVVDTTGSATDEIV